MFVENNQELEALSSFNILTIIISYNTNSTQPSTPPTTSQSAHIFQTQHPCEPKHPQSHNSSTQHDPTSQSKTMTTPKHPKNTSAYFQREQERSQGKVSDLGLQQHRKREKQGGETSTWHCCNLQLLLQFAAAAADFADAAAVCCQARQVEAWFWAEKRARAWLPSREAQGPLDRGKWGSHVRKWMRKREIVEWKRGVVPPCSGHLGVAIE